jgi:hypothetical protein
MVRPIRIVRPEDSKPRMNTGKRGSEKKGPIHKFFAPRCLDRSIMQPRAVKFESFYTKLDFCLLSVDNVKGPNENTIGSRRFINRLLGHRLLAENESLDLNSPYARRWNPALEAALRDEPRLSVGEAARPGPDPSGTRSQPCSRMRSIPGFSASGLP